MFTVGQVGFQSEDERGHNCRVVIVDRWELGVCTDAKKGNEDVLTATDLARRWQTSMLSRT